MEQWHHSMYSCKTSTKLHKETTKSALIHHKTRGNFNQIRLKCSRWIANCEVSWHLNDQLFHGVCKHVRDSIRYLYSNPETTYSQLMVTTHKAESEMEEAKGKVRARSAATTKVVDGSKELGYQIVRLITTLTWAEQGITLLVLQIVPGTGVMGEGGQIRILLSTPAPTMVGLAWVRPPPLTGPLLQVR